MSEQDRAPGWYQDPSGPPGAQRWWNGISWGDQTRWPAGTPFPQPFGPPVSPRRGRSPVAWILSGCLVVLLLLGGGLAAVILLVVRATDGPRGVVTAYFDDLEQGRYESAAARLCGEYAPLGAEGLRRAYPERVLDGDVRSVSREDDTATVRVDLTVGSASAFPVTLNVVREGGDWKVCSLPG